jgi:hypothetical protein
MKQALTEKSFPRSFLKLLVAGFLYSFQIWSKGAF